MGGVLCEKQFKIAEPGDPALTDEQVVGIIVETRGAAHISPQSAGAFARAVEAAVLRVNGLESDEDASP